MAGPVESHCHPGRSLHGGRSGAGHSRPARWQFDNGQRAVSAGSAGAPAASGRAGAFTGDDTEAAPPARSHFRQVHLRKWRNGRRTSLRGWRGQPRGGSNPLFRTSLRSRLPRPNVSFGSASHSEGCHAEAQAAKVGFSFCADASAMRPSTLVNITHEQSTTTASCPRNHRTPRGYTFVSARSSSEVLSARPSRSSGWSLAEKSVTLPTSSHSGCSVSRTSCAAHRPDGGKSHE